MGEKSERWAFQRIRELEQQLEQTRRRLHALTASRDVWRRRAHDPVLKGRWRK